jgi:hypothetical protein
VASGRGLKSSVTLAPEPEPESAVPTTLDPAVGVGWILGSTTMGLTVTGPRAESVDVGPTSISGTRLLGGCEGRVFWRVRNSLGPEGRPVKRTGNPAVLVGKMPWSVVCVDWMIVVGFGIRVERVERVVTEEVTVVLAEREFERELDIPATSLGSDMGMGAVYEPRDPPAVRITVTTFAGLSVTAGKGMTVSEEEEEEDVSPTGEELIGGSPPSSAPTTAS